MNTLAMRSVWLSGLWIPPPVKARTTNNKNGGTVSPTCAATIPDITPYQPEKKNTKAISERVFNSLSTLKSHNAVLNRTLRSDGAILSRPCYTLTLVRTF